MTGRGEKVYGSDAGFPPLSKDKLRIYSMRFCPFAQRPRLIAEQKNIPYECINIDLRDKPAWFLGKFDLGTVPVLEDRGKIIPESLIASEYLDEMYQGPKLIPSDPFIKAKHNILVQRFGKLITKYYKALRGTLEENEDLFHELKYFEDELCHVNGTFLGGERPCFADFMIWPWCERFEIFPDIANARKKYPRFAAWLEAMPKEPAVKATMLSLDLHKGFIKGYVEKKADYDFGLA